MVRLTDPTASELQQAQIDATTALQQAQMDLQREQAAASREDAATAAEASATEAREAAGAAPQPTFAELTAATAQLAQIGDLDAVNSVRDALAARLGTSLPPLTEIVAASSAAAVEDNVRENPMEGTENTDEPNKPVEGEEKEDQGKKPKPKPTGEGGAKVDESGKGGGKAGDTGGRRDVAVRGWDPESPNTFPTRVLKRIVDLETKLELQDVDQNPLTLEAAIRRLFEGMEAEVRRNLPEVIAANE
jgi:hypothetical protein